MENRNIYFTQKKFDEVWNRVTASEPTDADTVKTLMEYEFSDMHTYRFLAKKYSGIYRVRFTEMANDELRHFKILQAKYFILTGKIYTPRKPETPSAASLREVLSEQYKIENEAAAGYLKAAEKASSEHFSEICRKNSEDELSHARTVLFLLGSSFM